LISRTSAAVIEEAREQPAAGRGSARSCRGDSTLEVSAMKCTPAWTITEASAVTPPARARLSPTIVAHAVEDLGRHVVVGQDDGVLLALQPVDLGDQRGLQPPLHRGDVMLDLVPAGALSCSRVNFLDIYAT
jgi:hypothetical protein